jgi:hypothetical protein
MLRGLQWSQWEKALARRAFNKALEQELEEVISEAKEKAAKVQEASQLWKLERWLGQRRLDIDRKYDYRYSVLPMVFANLLSEGRIGEEDLRGLDAYKIAIICHLAGVSSLRASEKS